MKYGTICKHHLYDKTFRKGKKSVCPSIAVYVLKDLWANRLMRANPAKQKYNRVGLFVPKTAEAGSVGRNRIKRVLREAYRLTEKEYPVRHGYLVVIASRPGAAGKKTQQIQKELVTALKRLDMIIPDK